MSTPANSQQNEHKSTTVWSQPKTEEQRKYFSKHAKERTVFGWITTIFQTAHGFLAFAAWTGIYAWVFKHIPFLMPIAPVLSVLSLFALHVLFRVTWQTYWYDKLDDDPKTDSPVWVPGLIVIVLLVAEVQGASQFLTQQIKPVEKQDPTLVDSHFTGVAATLKQQYDAKIKDIATVYLEKTSAATSVIDHKIAKLRTRRTETEADRKEIRRQIASLESQRENVLAPIRSAKAEAMQQALDAYNASLGTATARRESQVASIDSQNQQELSRYASDMGNVYSYAWVLSVALLGLIAGLSFRVVKINVSSGIIPLRNYTILDAHGSIPERIWTALSDAANRRGQQFAVWLHQWLSPNDAITSFDGTVVAKPGTYNTPAGFFPKEPAQPAPADADERAKVFVKLMEATKKGETIELTPELLESELQKAKTMNGSYMKAPLGKTKPSTESTSTGGVEVPSPSAVESSMTYDQMLKYWADRVIKQVNAYDEKMAAGNKSGAEEHQRYLTVPAGPISTEAFRLGLEYGVFKGQPEIMVWLKETPEIMVPISKLTEAALKTPIAPEELPAAGEEESLFKQNLDLFKQTIEAQYNGEGKVIGVKYKKANGEWAVDAQPQVEAFVRTYTERVAKKPSDATRVGLEKWQYALSLFGQPQQKNENVEPITH